MRILQITDGIPPATLGGTGQIVTDVSCALARRGHDVTLLTAAQTKPHLEHVKIKTVEPLPDRFAHFRCVFSTKREREMMSVIDEVKPDLIHAHTISRQLGYRWITQAKKKGIPVIIHAHDVSHVACGKVTGFERSVWWHDLRRCRLTFNPLRKWMIRSLLTKANRILTVSDALKNYMHRHGYKNLRMLHNGIDLNFWKPKTPQDDARKQLHLPQDKPIFLLAGRLGHDKGSVLIANTFPKDARLILAGERFADLFDPIKEFLHLFPRQTPEQMKLLHSACDVVLVPSRCLDCFPTVCLEAMAMEKPVIATSWGGAKESVEDGRTGWIVDPMDEDAWALRMAWCLSHRQELETMGKAGRKRMEQHFSLTHFIDHLEQVYTACS